MDGGDRYRKLLASASHAQKQRLVEIHHGQQHLAGNVFLPAIQQRSSAQSALSIKHLQVIEQCILAENRREAQLAKCPSEKERRYLSRKFLAQRDHERDLLQALMLGRPTDAELEIVDVETSVQAPSPFHSRSTRGGGGGGGVHIVSGQPEKRIIMHGEKTFTTTTRSDAKPTKAVSPHFHGVKSPVRRLEERANENVALPEWKASPSKPSMRVRPTKERQTKSASPTSKSPPQSPSHTSKGAMDAAQLPHALTHSPFRQSVRQQVRSQREAKPSPLSSPTRRGKKRPTAPTNVLSESLASEDTSGAVMFSGATSFHEARQHAIAILRETSGAIDDGTQTTDRSCGLDGSTATINERLGRRDQQFVLMLTNDSTSKRHDRPHSSPETRPRRPSADAHLLPALAHSSSSDTVLQRVEFLHASSDPSALSKDGAVTKYTTDDRAIQIHVLSKEEVPEAIAHRLVKPAPAEANRWADVTIKDQSDACGTEKEYAHLDCDDLDRLAREDDTVEWEALEELAREHDAAAQVSDEGESPSLLDAEQDAHVILDILYDIVHKLETPPSPVEKTIAIERTPQARPKSAFVDYGRFAIRIQSAFRGLRARRVFRLALYQQALESGVLGAMPGSQQGHSGWYQDPKSFMAYYFVVRPDGEWVQKAALRCSTLVLTPYAMHAQILTRMHAPVDTEELM